MRRDRAEDQGGGGGSRHTRSLRGPYQQYEQRVVPSVDAEITQTGPGTPCGEYLRCFWQPVAMSSEVKNLPLATRIMGEDLVLFRAGDGQLGLLERHCSHRGASLEFGRVEANGLRCCYHGWLYGADGTILEMPGEIEPGALRGRVFHGAYPVQEFRGLIFAYLGPPDLRPPFPHFDVYDLPGDRLVPYAIATPCNWLQVHENSVDPAHGVFLHTIISGTQFSSQFAKVPLMEFHQSPIGMFCVSTRRVDDRVWVRINDAILPNLMRYAYSWEEAEQDCFFGRGSGTKWTIPVDDTHCRSIGWRHFGSLSDPRGVGKEEEVGLESVDFMGQTGDRPYHERQRVPGDYDAQVSQRPIAVHAREHLVVSDGGVVLLRRLLRAAVHDLAAGGPPPVLAALSAGVVSTYTGDTVVHAPPLPGADDRETMAAVTRRVLEVLTDAANGQGEARRLTIRGRLAKMFPGDGRERLADGRS
ncbi:MAG: aromatic ring-hydroxylating dioxygenase subunit alpha [Alphaproteobacteria bacterium]|nr:aromatic ring-hydroxylating dioxygenase subunit alpha [Alphaproteobacteria bacterium]